LSETSPSASCNPTTSTEFSGTIGVPIPSTWMKLVDDDGHDVTSLGTPGEIAIKGPQVMAGYWQRPDETARVMTADGYFKSGDIGIMDERGYKTKIQAGSNRALPYPDAHFDLLLSVNTLHYEGSEENFLAALKEFRRVLKPGGGVYISTVGPEHEIYRRAEMLGDHRYRIRDFDFRNGEEFFFCDSERYLQHYCEQVFETVETGRSTEKLIKLPLDFLIALCR
jgi:SAM-dependent methyltransferase